MVAGTRDVDEHVRGNVAAQLGGTRAVRNAHEPCNGDVNTTSLTPRHLHGLQGPEELFETTAQCLISGMDRDALSGWGAVIYIV